MSLRLTWAEARTNQGRSWSAPAGWVYQTKYSGLVSSSPGAQHYCTQRTPVTQQLLIISCVLSIFREDCFDSEKLIKLSLREDDCCIQCLLNWKSLNPSINSGSERLRDWLHSVASLHYASSIVWISGSRLETREIKMLQISSTRNISQNKTYFSELQSNFQICHLATLTNHVEMFGAKNNLNHIHATSPQSSATTQQLQLFQFLL